MALGECATVSFFSRNYPENNCNEVKAKWRTCPVGELGVCKTFIDAHAVLYNSKKKIVRFLYVGTIQCIMMYPLHLHVMLKPIVETDETDDL